MATIATVNTEGLTDEEKRVRPFQEMDALDEQQIVAEMKGQILEQYFYTFEQWNDRLKKTETKVGLSYAGIKTLARRMSEQGHPLSVVHHEEHESADGRLILATCVVQDLSTGEKRVGAAESERQMPRYKWENGKKTDEVIVEVTRPFAYTAAVSKAQRNALRMFLPEKVIEEGYKEWKTNKEKLPVK